MVWDIAGRFNEYSVPKKASILVGNGRLRRAMLEWVMKYYGGGALGAFGLSRDEIPEPPDPDAADYEERALEMLSGAVRRGNVADYDSMEGHGLLHVLKYLTMCTATLTYGCHSRSLKHRAEEAVFEGEEGHTYVGNGVAIAAVLMCGGLARVADWPNARLTVRIPKTCGARGGTGCGRYMAGSTRARLCSACRSMPYSRRARADFTGPGEVAAMVGGAARGHVPARVQDTFPPESDLFGPAPLPAHAGSVTLSGGLNRPAH